MLAQRIEDLASRAPILWLHPEPLLFDHDRASREGADHAIRYADGVAARQQQGLQLPAFATAQARMIGIVSISSPLSFTAA